MTSKAWAIVASVFLSVAVVVGLSTIVVIAAPYNPCQVPPVVGQATRPNVMIVMDYSGSMQFPAYFGAWETSFQGYYDSKVAYQSSWTWQSDTASYNPSFQYYGTFDPDTYYVYDTTGDFFKAADPQPVLYYTGTAESADAGGGAIWLTCEGHNFQVNDVVAVYDLGSHKSLNGDGHQVLGVQGAKLKVACTWNGKPDPIGYKAIKRITGDTSIGISGNILNLAVTSRIDAALKALIGGRATTVSGDTTNVYIQSQGARRYVTESTNVNAAFYVRPATLGSSVYYPNDYSSGTYLDKDIFVSISGQYSGQINSSDPVKYGEHTEPWKLTLTRSNRVIITLQGNWPNGNGSRLAIYSDANLNNLVTGADSSSSSSHSVTLEKDLAAGTYYLRVAPVTDFTSAYSYSLWSNVQLEKSTTLYTDASNHQGVALTKIGSIPWARVRIQVPEDERKGLVHEAFPYVRIGFMYYKGDVKANKGKILVGCENTDIDRLINAMEGRDTDSSDGLDFTQAFPYQGTPTGPALQEVYDYFNQHSNSDHADNSLFVSSSTWKTSKDPYYGAGASGAAVPVPCRKSFALLLSDGVWNDGTDPVNPAVSIHTDDLRPENQEAAFTGDQIVDIYSILAFSQDPQGENSMKAVAMYGSFKNVSGCGNDNFPYPRNGTPSDSKLFPWPVPECNPNAGNCNPPGSCSGSSYYNVTCCKEWNAVWDRNNDAVDENKGSPDAYYKANNGKELQAALQAVFADVISRHASASAVATVSQELRTGDIIVRGVFDAADPDQVDSYLWTGHLEAFRPFMYNNEEKYSFEFACNAGRLCMDMPGTDAPCPSLGRSCIDTGYILSNSTTPSERTIFTFDPDAKTQEDFDTSNTYLTECPDSTATDGLNRLGYYEVSQTAETQNLINWVRGTEVTGFRDRTGWLDPPVSTKPWRLGDIVYSTPVVIGPPGLGEVSRRDPDVSAFHTHRNNNIHRMKVVYVGANDGMLHAFVLGKYDENGTSDTSDDKWVYDPTEDGDIGKELWAYIPSNLLTEFRHTYDKGLANTTYGHGGCTHRYMVDLASRSWEVYINPKANRPDLSTNPCGTAADAQGRCWRSVVVGGERGGGDVYFAIDVTDPLSPIVLWEYPVFKNRVVVEVAAPSGSNPNQCIHDCRNACDDHSSTNTCWSTRGTCRDACPPCVCTRWYWWGGCRTEDCTARDTCRGVCETAYNTCVANCEADCVTQCSSTGPSEKSFVPFRSVYDSVKILPMSWSQPYLGRIQIPTTVKFYVGDPSPLDMDNGGDPSTSVQFDANNNKRAVAFMGGGLHLYDRDFDPQTVRDGLKLALFWPFFLMMDIETGNNLFEYVWPRVVNQAWEHFPLKSADVNTIPYAMTDPIALDVWNQNADIVGDDGFIDRIYVGDMNGYFYGIKFNLDPQNGNDTNSDFGILVDLWPMKEILTGDLTTNNYRSDHQPITVSAAATFEKGATDHLRVIIGAGKYDDVSTSEDDKTDTAKMSIYNLRDKVELPDLSSAYEVYDSSHTTGFKVAFQQRCDGVDFNTGCTWVKVASTANDADKTTICSDPDDLSTCVQVSRLSSTPDCCEDTCTSPCYKCVYDLTLPTETGLPGERVVGKPLIAGGLVFLTTFVPPSDPCGYTGEGFLYFFDVNCDTLVDPSKVIPGSSGTAVGAVTGSGTAPGGVRVSLGSGVPSKPVLDSRGENVIIQMSDGTLKRIPVELPLKPIASKGWRAR